MRKTGWLAVLLALSVLLAACGGEGRETPEGPVLWFCAGQEDHGPALSPRAYDGALRPEALLNALLAGPGQEEGLRSPFPRGVTLLECGWDEERPGVLLVDLSEQYGALADVSLSLADYSIVLTLSQVEGVEGVEITAGGRMVSYRSHQLMSAGEAVLWDELADGPAGAPPQDT